MGLGGSLTLEYRLAWRAAGGGAVWALGPVAVCGAAGVTYSMKGWPEATEALRGSGKGGGGDAGTVQG